MMKRLTWKKEEGKKNQFQYQNTGSNLAALFIQTVLESNYPMQAPNKALLWPAD